MHVGTSEAAKRLGVSDRRLRVLLQDGRIRAQRVGGRWVIDEADLARYYKPHSPGRPLSRRSAWQLIQYARCVASLEPIERYRWRQRLRRFQETSEPLELLTSLLARRAEKFELSYAPDDLAEFRKDPRIRLSGVSHPAAGLLSNVELEAYVDAKDYDALRKDWFLVKVDVGLRPNVVLHVADDIPEELPLLLVAVDLAERVGVRERKAALEIIGSLKLHLRQVQNAKPGSI